MGWRIAVFENHTLKITKKVAKELFKAYEVLWDNVDSVTDEKGFLAFNYDHMEHMDYVYHPEVIKVLKKNKAKGRILFNSTEGDNSGMYWGHEFDGKGNYFSLTGIPSSIEWIRSTNKEDEDDEG